MVLLCYVLWGYRSVSDIMLPFDSTPPTVTVSATRSEFTNPSQQLADVGLKILTKDGSCKQGNTQVKLVVWADEGFVPTSANGEWRSTFAQVRSTPHFCRLPCAS